MCDASQFNLNNLYNVPYTIPVGFTADPDPAFYLKGLGSRSGICQNAKSYFRLFFFLSKFLSPSKEVIDKKAQKHVVPGKKKLILFFLIVESESKRAIQMRIHVEPSH